MSSQATVATTPWTWTIPSCYLKARKKKARGEIPAGSRKGVPSVAGSKNVAACAKHFVGDKGTTGGINEKNTIIDRHGLLNIHMPAYYNLIIKGVATIMISYTGWNGEKMHANRDPITTFLQNTLHFREHRELAREAVRKSLVLLNGEFADKPLLPLPKKAIKILVAGSHADNLGFQCGGWTRICMAATRWKQPYNWYVYSSETLKRVVYYHNLISLQYTRLIRDTGISSSTIRVISETVRKS